jgi:hypothetical protein
MVLWQIDVPPRPFKRDRGNHFPASIPATAALCCRRCPETVSMGCATLTQRRRLALCRRGWSTIPRRHARLRRGFPPTSRGSPRLRRRPETHGPRGLSRHGLLLTVQLCRSKPASGSSRLVGGAQPHAHPGVLHSGPPRSSSGMITRPARSGAGLGSERSRHAAAGRHHAIRINGVNDTGSAT